MDTDTIEKGLCGLVNIGNTCYLNSILQMFFNNKHFLKYMLSDNYKLNNNNNNNIIIELNKLIKNVWDEKSIILPKSFIEIFSNIVKENLNQQNDPDEYYEKIITLFYEETCQTNNIYDSNINHTILDNIENNSDKEWYKSFNNKLCFINKLFYGQYKSEVCCSSCNYTHINYEPFISIKLELKHSDLLNCLKTHLSWENNISFTCDKCKNSNISKKRLTLIRLPDIISFTLKRYNNIINKNSKNINFPYLFEIDNNKYELVSIINHHGMCLEMGHYTNFSKHNINKQWYNFNDNNISLIDINNINKTDIYMLFYNKI